MSDELEILIMQYLDGEMPEAERQVFELRLQSDPAARRLLEEHRALTGALKNELPMPAVDWGRLAGRISNAAAEQNAVAQNAQAADVRADEAMESAITQYLDGELTGADRAAVEDRIAADPAAGKLLAEYRSLDTILKHAWPLPHVDYERLAEHLSEAVAEEAEEAAPSTIRLYANYAARFAMAACLAFIVGMGIFFLVRGHETVSNGTKIASTNTPKSVISVAVVGAEVARGPRTIDIRISPSPEIAAGGYDPYAAEDILRPNRLYAAVPAGPASPIMPRSDYFDWE